MRILILGGDGYLGWPTAMHFAARGDDVCVVDNYLRRTMALETDSEPLFDIPVLNERVAAFERLSGKKIKVVIADISEFDRCSQIVKDFDPDTIVHYAEQPSGPYSMRNRVAAELTLKNNLGTTFNVIWSAINHNPDTHIVKLGTMGEYGTPNIDIEEGWLDVTHKGRSDRFLYPRAAGSLYHTTKVLDTDLLWFYVRTYNLRVTDLMQGPVYGFVTPENRGHENLFPNFHYDDIFGTAVNRFLVQAVAGIPLTVYGQGGQTRGYLNLNDTLQCVALAADSPVAPGDLRILNQFTEQFSVNELAERVQQAGKAMGLDVAIKSIENPRKEKEQHYYNAAHSGLLELGLQPNYMAENVLSEMLGHIIAHKDKIAPRKIMPRVKWS
ncbi:MAG: NAD-dependent epimerase/dehydratase family protein [Rhodobacterales bacterium]